MQNKHPVLVTIEDSFISLLLLEKLEVLDLLKAGITMGLSEDKDIAYFSCEPLKSYRYFIDRFYFEELAKMSRARNEYLNITAGNLVKESYLKLI